MACVTIAAMQRSNSPDLRYLALALLVTWVGFALRLHNLDGDSLWLDEMLTIWTVQGELVSIWDAPTHPPLNYLLTAFAMVLVGTSEFAVRLPALIAGTLTIPLCLVFGRTIGRSQAGLWLALLLAFSPFHLRYSQEARQYALLLLLSLLSFVLLYRAMQQPRRSIWFCFGLVTVLNVYNHYAAFVVLLAQSVWILCWWLWQPISSWRPKLEYIVTAVAVVILFYLPWLPRFWTGILFNTTEGVTAHTGPPATWLDWVSTVYVQFGLYDGYRPLLFFLLGLLGLALLFWRRKWSTLVLFSVGFALPLLLVAVLPFSRGAMGRYIIYLLPFYLLPIALLLEEVTNAVNRWLNRPLFMVVAGLLVAAIVQMAWPIIQYEYEFMEADWRGILDYLEPRANDGDVLLTMSMNFAHGFNMVGGSLPYYSAQRPRTYRIVRENWLWPADIEMLSTAHESVQVWAVVHNWERDLHVLNESYVVVPFLSHLYLITDQEPVGTVLERSIVLYEQLVPLATEPSPQCLLQLDLAYLYIAAGEFDLARLALAESKTACPNRWQAEREMRQTAYLEAWLAHNMVEEKWDEVYETAVALLNVHSKHEQALKALTVESLLTRVTLGEATIDDSHSPEPVAIRQFIMPQNGDWGDVIFMHPPASIAFDLHLPAKPVALSFRVANDPQSWEWGGDGTTFVVRLTPMGEEPVELYRHHISNDPDDRDWHAAFISLADYAGQPVRLTLATEGGPQGDITGDWAGWHRPKIVWQTEMVPQR
jgi:mannosyltransferase